MWLLELFKSLWSLLPARGDRREDFKAVTEQYEHLIRIIGEQRDYFEKKLTECRADHEELNKRLVDASVKYSLEIAGLKGQIKEMSEEVAVLRAWKHSLDPVQQQSVEVIREGIKRIEARIEAGKAE